MSGDLAFALAESGDERPWTPATVLAVDDVAARVTVNLDGSGVSLRRVTGAYRVGDPVIVVRDPARSGAGQYVAGVIGPAVAASPIWLPGVVTAINTGTSRLTVTVAGVSMTLPYVSATYTVGGNVAVLIDAASTTGGIVLGPLGNPPAPPPPPPPPALPPVPDVPSIGTFTALILPTWSGSWRSIRGAYDRWADGGVPGGFSNLYQGNAYGSGAMVGIAVYGDQVAGLGALAITAMTVNSILATGSGWPQFQGTPQGTPYPGAPTPSGAAPAGVGQVGLDASICEAFRTGAFKGLCTVGAAYCAVRGTSLADGMALTVTYTKAI